MGFFDLFKKGATTEEACKLFEDTFKNQEFAGYPSMKTSTNFYVSPYNTLNKDVCNFDIKFENKFKMSFTFRYSKKDKNFSAVVWFYNMVITDKVEQIALGKTFPSLKINFLPTAVTVCVLNKPCTSLDDLKNCVNEAKKIWNESGFFGLVKSEFNPKK